MKISNEKKIEKYFTQKSRFSTKQRNRLSYAYRQKRTTPYKYPKVEAAPLHNTYRRLTFVRWYFLGRIRAEMCAMFQGHSLDLLTI